ncbi:MULTISPECIES: M23 family metallopeptidase [Cetobacterium]|uniref:M23 family metallopeptidase n=1 Tax=Candidatus Cetobacterium colombiensis TaxID=3073100 RepID=A0ABU4WD91_9FUSO|nr:M23 family metallopeptidase [Candidatus Cetobacterium colombiensis]MDX8336982.1 M23 family metallopeptidase [Candidatus Cetobacterium colombiensis]
MKEIFKIFAIIIVAFIVMLILVFKPYKSEVVDLKKFTEYYSETSTVEDGGGFELVDENFYTMEKEYKIGEEESLEGVPLEEVDLKQAYEIPKLESYIVANGDTLGTIADKNGISLEILKANNPGIANNLKVGQKINIVKSNGVFYKVKRGDSLFKIALNYKVDVEDLRKYNNLKNDNIRVGEELFIYNPSENSLKRLTQKGGVKVKRVTVQKYFSMPVKYSGVTSPFGKRFHPVLKRYIQHAGVDLRARYVPLMASKDGVIIYTGYMTGYGKIIKIKHSEGYETRSAHLDKIYVKTGDKVKAGQVIGKTGMSGRVTGPHLHFEIRKNGRANNPMNYLVR